MARNLSRDAKVYIQLSGTTLGSSTAANTWEVPVLDGFSFTQDSGTQEITISEAGATPTRGMKTFTTSLNPVDWSMSTYIKGFTSIHATNTDARPQAVELILWNAMVSNVLGVGDSAFADVATSGITTNVLPADGTTPITASDIQIDFENSDVHELLKVDIFFSFENTTYKISECQVNSAELDFSIDSIAMINWSGQGTTYEEVSGADHTTIQGWTSGTDYYPSPVGVITGCIKNRFTTMVVVDNNAGSPTNGDYFTIPITGGSLTIDNGITYLTPEELGRVNTSCGSFTGTRSITGSVTAYLNTDNGETGADEANGKPTGVLINTMLNLTDATNTSFDILLRMGGTATDRARVDLHLGTAHLVIPTVNTEDVIATEISFTGQGSTGLESQDELVVTYYPAFTDVHDEEA